MVATFLISACQPEQAQEDLSTFRGFRSPGHFPPAVYKFEQNPVTKEGFELGRKLFYDPLLSRNGKISCSGCHHQSAGFSDPRHAFSTGIDGKTGKRHTPALANLAWYPSFMWDGGINHIEVMPLAPLTDSSEMDQDLGELIQKLQRDPTYPDLFKNAFGSSEITSRHMLLALAQFMGMMISDNSRFDKYLHGEVEFTDKELKGYAVFKQNCASSCHSGPLQSDFSYRNNGLITEDPGRFLISGKEEDKGKFKVPSLRNVSFSAPYMHNGQFETLDEVLDHYTSDLTGSPGIDTELQEKITLTDEDRQSLLLFLESLTDYSYLTNEELSEP